ncbi:MAG: THUMP-like domain-containing protein [Candidatus Gracilibacteria bacterium]
MTELFRDFLQTEQAAELTKIIDSLKGDTLKIHSSLSKRSDKEQILPYLPDMLLLRDLREKAEKKFSQAPNMFFTRRGLEQSTGENIAEHKASWISTDAKVLVLCSGIGGEMISLAKKAQHVTAVDNDAEICEVAALNADAYSVKNKITFINDTVEHFLEKYNGEGFDAVYIDPDRRPGDSRKVELSQYLPNIYEILPQLLKISKDIYCKVSPRIFRDELTKIQNLSSYEFIQEDQDLKECVLHFTPLADDITKIATKISNNTAIHLYSKESQSHKQILLDEKAVKLYLFEPYACVMRAELVEQCAENIDGIFLAEKGALLTSDILSETGKDWGTYFEICTVLPFHPATIKTYCKDNALDKIIIKKRYFPLEPHEIRKFLKIKEGGNDIFYCTTLADKKVIIHCRRVLP